jgi:hypothetical protein
MGCGKTVAFLAGIKSTQRTCSSAGAVQVSRTRAVQAQHQEIERPKRCLMIPVGRLQWAPAGSSGCRDFPSSYS